jgi:hypothetical protein
MASSMQIQSRVRSIVIVCVLTSAAGARADPVLPMFAGAGVGAGGFTANAYEFVEAGVAVHPALPIFVHAVLAHGSWDVEDVGGGDYTRGEVGLLARGCSRTGRACGYASLDGGDVHFSDVRVGNCDVEPFTGCDSVTLRGLTAGGHAGLDAGGRHLRVRIGLQVAHAFGSRFDLATYRPQPYSLANAVGLDLELLVMR